MHNSLESKTDEELIAIYSSQYPSPLDARSIKKLMKNDNELYKEMERRKLFINLRHIVTPGIVKEYERIQEEDKEREAEGREGIIKKYDLSLDKFSRIMIERKTGTKLKTEGELKHVRLIKIVNEMVKETFEGIEKLKDYEVLYKFQLSPIKRIVMEGGLDINDLRKTAESLKDLDNERGYESIDKLKKYMGRIYHMRAKN